MTYSICWLKSACEWNGRHWNEREKKLGIHMQIEITRELKDQGSQRWTNIFIWTNQMRTGIWRKPGSNAPRFLFLPVWQTTEIDLKCTRIYALFAVRAYLRMSSKSTAICSSSTCNGINTSNETGAGTLLKKHKNSCSFLLTRHFFHHSERERQRNPCITIEGDQRSSSSLRPGWTIKKNPVRTFDTTECLANSEYIFVGSLSG